jgi:hypothetical protein
MRAEEQPFETDHHSLTGSAAVDLYGDGDFNELAMKLIDDYNPDNLDAVALRFFIQEDSPVITLYAVDKLKQEQNNYPKDRLPVKKFKIDISFADFLKHIKRFDFTVSNDSYDIKDILVTKK